MILDGVNGFPGSRQLLGNTSTSAVWYTEFNGVSAGSSIYETWPLADELSGYLDIHTRVTALRWGDVQSTLTYEPSTDAGNNNLVVPLLFGPESGEGNYSSFLVGGLYRIASTLFAEGGDASAFASISVLLQDVRGNSIGDSAGQSIATPTSAPNLAEANSTSTLRITPGDRIGINISWDTVVGSGIGGTLEITRLGD